MTNPSDQAIKGILTNAMTIAVVGASSKTDRASHGVMKVLLRQGYKVIPINPNEDEILGQKAYASLSDIPSDIHIDIVDVFRKAAATPEIAREAAKIGADTLWLQLGIENEESEAIAKKAGMNYVSNACIAIELGRHDIAPK